MSGYVPLSCPGVDLGHIVQIGHFSGIGQIRHVGQIRRNLQNIDRSRFFENSLGQFSQLNQNISEGGVCGPTPVQPPQIHPKTRS